MNSFAGLLNAGGPWVRAEVIGGCLLLQGDCLEIMPHLSELDAIVTDPPYSSGGFTQASITKAKGQGLRSATIAREGWFAGDAMTAAGGAFLLREIARVGFGVSKPAATLTAFTDWRVSALYAPAIESARWRYQNMIVWDKGSAGLGTGFRAQHELALHFSKGSPVYFSAAYENVIRCPRVRVGDREHQTQKPVPLMRRIVETVAPQGGLVLDCFMGSGTTGVAACSIGRRFVGIEVDPIHFETACERIASELTVLHFLFHRLRSWRREKSRGRLMCKGLQTRAASWRDALDPQEPRGIARLGVLRSVLGGHVARALKIEAAKNSPERAVGWAGQP